MMAVDGRRLLRAGALTLAVFLFVGGGVGFAAAAAERADDARTLTVPAPRPGDRATYTIHEVIVDPLLAPWHVGVTEVTYEWLPERWELDADFQQRLVHPLRATFSWGRDDIVVESTYDAATGDPVSEIHAWNGTNLNWDAPVIDPTNTPFYELGERRTRYDQYQGQVGSCGLSLPFAGRAYDGTPQTIAGRCDWPGGRQASTLEGQGWRRTDEGRVFRFTAVEDARFEYDVDEASPFPARFDAVLSEVLPDDDTAGRSFDLVRRSFEPGTGKYTPAAQPTVQAAPPVRSVPLTPWTLDDSDVTKHFTLAQAYEAVLGQGPVRAPNTARPTAEDPPLSAWLQEHPDGYLAHASTIQRHDRNGQRVTFWYLLWVDGDASLGKQVEYGPPGDTSYYLPSAVGERASVSDWPLSAFPQDGFLGSRLPKGLMPTALPKVSDLLERFALLTGHPGNSYGFTIQCATDACTGPSIAVEAGRSEADVREFLLGDLVTLVKPTLENSDHLQADGDGRLHARWMDVKSHDAVFPVVAPTTSDEGTSPRDPSAVTGAWVLPATPAAATGISLLALLAGALYYFWPAVKGALGAGLFSRIESHRVLELPARRRIHDAILAEPGIHFMALSRKAGLARGALDHHLRLLVAADLVVVHRAPGYTCYFAKGAVARHLVDAAPMLRSEGSRAVFDAVRAEPGLSCRDLARRLGRSPSTVNYHLQRLREAGLVFGEGAGTHLSPLGEQAAAVPA